ASLGDLNLSWRTRADRGRPDTTMLSKLSLVLLGASLSAAAFGQASRLQVVGDEVELVVDDSRPVAKAVELLSSTYPVVITYEDPLYRYGGDAEDIGDHLPRRP